MSLVDRCIHQNIPESCIFCRIATGNPSGRSLCPACGKDYCICNLPDVPLCDSCEKYKRELQHAQEVARHRDQQLERLNEIIVKLEKEICSLVKEIK